MTALPPRVRTEVERILAAEARRLLADQLDQDAALAAAGRNHHRTGADQRSRASTP